MKWISLSELSTSKNIIHFKMCQLMCYPEQWHPKAGSKVPHLTIIVRPTICTNSTNWRSWPQYFIFILIPPDLMLRLDWSLEKKLMNVEIEFIWTLRRKRIDVGSHPLLSLSGQPQLFKDPRLNVKKESKKIFKLSAGVDFSSSPFFSKFCKRTLIQHVFFISLP